MVNHTNQQLEQAKKTLEQMGYQCEMGARHINVLIDDPEIDENELEKELSQKTNVEVWVMQDKIMLVED